MMHNPLISLILLCLLSLLPIGVVLLLWTILRGPDVTRPSCRACGFDLRQCNYLPGIPERCPQCSQPLDRSGTRFGRNGTPWKRITAALLLLLSPLCFWAASRQYTAAVKPQTIPTPQLIEQVQKLQLDPALPELTTRLRARRLSISDIDQILSHLLHHSQELEGWYPPGRDSAAEFIVHARRQKGADSATIATIAKALVYIPSRRPSFSTGKGGQILHASFVEFQPRLAVDRDIWNVVSLRQLLLSDGTILYDRASATDADAHATLGDIIVQLPLQHALSPGTHKVKAILDCGVVEADPPLLGTDGTPGIPPQVVQAAGPVGGAVHHHRQRPVTPRPATVAHRRLVKRPGFKAREARSSRD